MLVLLLLMLDQTYRLFPELGSRQASVLQAALHLFSQKGYFNTSIQEIVTAGGVSVGFTYHHFNDKMGIAHALYRHLLGGMDLILDQIEQQHSRAEDQCKAVIHALFALTETEADAMSFIVHARHREFLPAEKSICSASAFVRMRRFVAKGIESGELKTIDPMVASALMYGATIRLVCLRLDDVITEPLPGYFDELWQQTWSTLGA